MKTTTEQIVLKSKRNNVVIHEFDTIDAAKNWSEKWRARHGNRAPEAIITRVTITKVEEEIEHV